MKNDRLEKLKKRRWPRKWLFFHPDRDRGVVPAVVTLISLSNRESVTPCVTLPCIRVAWRRAPPYLGIGERYVIFIDTVLSRTFWDDQFSFLLSLFTFYFSFFTFTFHFHFHFHFSLSLSLSLHFTINLEESYLVPSLSTINFEESYLVPSLSTTSWVGGR